MQPGVSQLQERNCKTYCREPQEIFGKKKRKKKSQPDVWGLSAHLYIEVFPHPVDSDTMESSVCQVIEGGAEHIWTPVRLKVIPDLQTPWTQSMRRHEALSLNRPLQKSPSEHLMAVTIDMLLCSMQILNPQAQG